jgi:hypothetical protein
MLKHMGVIRGVALLALVVACDTGKTAPAKGSSEAAPLPVAADAPAPVDAMPIDTQLLAPSHQRVCNDTSVDLRFSSGPVMTPLVKKRTCSEYMKTSHAFNRPSMTFEANKTQFYSLPHADAVKRLAPGSWSFHITKLDFKRSSFTYDVRPDPTKEVP